MTTGPVRRLANAVIAVGSEGHHSGDLFDFELLARPAQPICQDAGRRHDRSGRPAKTRATSPAAPPTLAAAVAARSARCGAILARTLVELGLEQALRIVAVRLV